MQLFGQLSQRSRLKHPINHPLSFLLPLLINHTNLQQKDSFNRPVLASPDFETIISQGLDLALKQNSFPPARSSF